MLLAAQIIWLAGYDIINRWRALEKEDEVARAALRTTGQTVNPNPPAPPQSKSEQIREGDDRRNRSLQQDALLQLLKRWWLRFGIDLESDPGATPTPSPTPNITQTQGTTAAPSPAISNTPAKASVTAESLPAVDNSLAETNPSPTLTPSASVAETTDDATPPPEEDTAPPDGAPPSTEDPVGDIPRNIRLLVAVETEVNIIQTYLLPLLYGLLGSCAYVLRQLTLEIRARTFRRELGISYWLHIFLGVLAGLAIGWFLRPETASDGLIRGLTPFALSFLAGYSVEVLFAGMDRLVTAFGPSSDKS